LWQARDQYGLDDIGEVAGAMRRFWPQTKIAEPTMIGFLKLKEILIMEKVYTEELLSDIILECSNYFADATRLHRQIDQAFQKEYPTNYKGMGVREKIASGIISVYEQVKPGNTWPKPFNIVVPTMVDDEVDDMSTDDADDADDDNEYV
jgi:hypothetical protein